SRNLLIGYASRRRPHGVSRLTWVTSPPCCAINALIPSTSAVSASSVTSGLISTINSYGRGRGSNVGNETPFRRAYAGRATGPLPSGAGNSAERLLQTFTAHISRDPASIHGESGGLYRPGSPQQRSDVPPHRR